KHITRHRGKRMDGRSAAQHGLKLCNHLAYLDRIAFPQIKNIKQLEIVFERTQDPLDDIIDVRKIAASCTVTVHIDRFPAVNQPRELVNSQIRSLPGTINREKSQTNDTKSVKIRIVRRKMFSGKLRRRIRAQSLAERLALAERNLFGRTINRGA